MIKVYMHYLKLKDFRNYEPVVIRTSFSSQDDIETFVRLKDVYLQKLQNGEVDTSLANPNGYIEEMKTEYNEENYQNVR